MSRIRRNWECGLLYLCLELLLVFRIGENVDKLEEHLSLLINSVALRTATITIQRCTNQAGSPLLYRSQDKSWGKGTIRSCDWQVRNALSNCETALCDILLATIDLLWWALTVYCYYIMFYDDFLISQQDSVTILLLQFSSLLVEHAAPHIHDSNNKWDWCMLRLSLSNMESAQWTWTVFYICIVFFFSESKVLSYEDWWRLPGRACYPNNVW